VCVYWTAQILLQAVPLDEAKIKLCEKNVYDQLVTENYRPHLPNTIPEGIVQVVSKAWSTKPSDRVSCDQLLQVIEKEIMAAA
jgi:hypothetical protein